MHIFDSEFFNRNLIKAKTFLAEQNIDYLLVNSTNDFLVEYSELNENSRYFITGFTGSTGDALLSEKELFLFVDGRYHIQADREVDSNIVTVVKLQTGQLFLDELTEKIPPNITLGIFSRKNSQCRVEALENKFKEKNVKIKFIDFDPITQKITHKKTSVTELSIELTGMSSENKIKKVSENFKDSEAVLVTNLEEVSYLFNLRDFSKNYSCVIKAKVIINAGGAKLFYEADLQEYESFIKDFDGQIFVDKSTINAYDYGLCGDRVRELKDSPVKLMKSIKTDAEIKHYKEAFKHTDKTMYAIRNYIENNDNISEYDIAERLEEEYKKYGAKILSFKSIVAKDKNSALAHYSKSSKEEIIKDGNLVLIDSGAFYEGGLATDITRVFVKGEPSELQKKVYTTVLKAFLNAFNYPNPKNGFEIDNKAREIIDENKEILKHRGQSDVQDDKIIKNGIETFVFNHGLGHGIGINVHEYPPSLSKHELAKAEIKDNMCFTIEPGLYNEEYFGIRLENSCYMKDRKIKSFTNMCYEKKLIDYDMLTEQEKEWLSNFEVK